ncbi:MAG TPA: hypothetical protein VL096_18760, partial [Pirellulaceae bacterium]|nr:hypothetical protein [Pirellulaceae bacterium]
MAQVTSGIKPWLTWPNGAWLVAYLATMGSIAYGLDYARRDSLDNMATPVAQAEWDEFRAEMTKQSQDSKSPVARRPPQ